MRNPIVPTLLLAIVVLVTLALCHVELAWHHALVGCASVLIYRAWAGFPFRTKGARDGS